MARIRTAFIWMSLVAVLATPIVIAGLSPYLQYRSPTYVIAGFAGIIGLALLLVQPLLAARYLPHLRRMTGRKAHRWIGVGIVACVAVHVSGLYLTSASDTMDALLLRAPTPFSVFGVIAMWGVILTAILALWRRRLMQLFRYWPLFHQLLATLIVVSTVIHAVQIEGTMGPLSKLILCVAVLVATGFAFVDLRIFQRR